MSHRGPPSSPAVISPRPATIEIDGHGDAAAERGDEPDAGRGAQRGDEPDQREHALARATLRRVVADLLARARGTPATPSSVTIGDHEQARARG